MSIRYGFVIESGDFNLTQNSFLESYLELYMPFMWRMNNNGLRIIKRIDE